MIKNRKGTQLFLTGMRWDKVLHRREKMFDQEGKERTFQAGDRVTLVEHENGIKLLLATAGSCTPLNWDWNSAGGFGDCKLLMGCDFDESMLAYCAKAIAAGCGLSLQKVEDCNRPSWKFI